MKKLTGFILSLFITLALCLPSHALNKVQLSPEYFPNPISSKALSNANIYVGIVDLDPEILANRKQVSVLQENGTIVAVSQPIKTGLGGTPVYNGSPVTMLVDGSYSLKVVNSYGAQVYYVPSSSANDQLDSVANVAALRALGYTPTDGAIAVLLGHTSNNDGGGGIVQYDANSVLADNNGTVFLQTGHAGAGRWVRQSDILSALFFNSDVASILAYANELTYFPAKTYNVTTSNTIGTGVLTLYGDGFSRTNTGTMAGTLFSGAGDLNFTSANYIFGLNLSGFGFEYTGTGTAITVNNRLNSRIKDVYLDCNASGSHGIQVTGSSFFTLIENATIQSFTDVGVLINTTGTKSVIRDCNIGASTASEADYAIEVRNAGTSIIDGQADISRTDNLGVGILFNNTSGSAIYGGKVDGTLFESDIGVKITGITHYFGNVTIDKARFTLGVMTTGVVFDRAVGCVVLNPTFISPTGNPGIEFTALAINCGLVGGYDACRSPMTVSGSATSCYKRCTDRILYSERASITTYANLTTTCDDVQHIGRTVHNGTAWDKFYITVADDAATSITPPKTIGFITIKTATGGGEHILANYNTTTGVTTSITVGGGSQISATDGTLDGTTGTDGYITLRSSSTGAIYIENRRGSSRNFYITFE